MVRESRKAFSAADTDRSGSITFNEFAGTFLKKNDRERRPSFSNNKLQQVSGSIQCEIQCAFS